MIKIDNFNKLIVANWKLNGDLALINDFKDRIKPENLNINNNSLIICPPAPYISYFTGDDYILGSQDCSVYNEGAYTGEISAKILKEIGCETCIIGHSERRIIFKENENSDLISKKLRNCLNNELIPILCIGENIDQKRKKMTKISLKNQLNIISRDFNHKNLIIAYEPVWAIGTGLIPSLDEISSNLDFIRNDVLRDKKIKILYGGSVKGSNYKSILNLDSVDGLLIGGASINIDDFSKIINF